MKSSRLLAVLSALAFAASAAFCEEPKEEPKPAPEKRKGKDYAPFPNPDAGYVTDLADLLTRDQEEEIEQWLWQVERKTSVEMVVVTLDSIRDYPGTPNRTIEQFATALFNKYGIGNLPKNDGVLLLVARKDRKARIELGAFYGEERDADATRIMQKTIVPRFKQEDYARGITEGVQELMREFAGVRVQPAPGKRSGMNWPLALTGGGAVLVGFIAYSLFQCGKRGWGWVAVGVLIVLILAFLQLLFRTLRAISERSGSSSGDSDSDSPGSSLGWSPGGFGGGFGGGSSGGGGATGSW